MNHSPQQILFDFAPSPKYPHAPALGKTATSRGMARKIAPRHKEAHRRILAMLRDGPLNADEIAEKLGMDVLYCRPRVTEMKELGLIEETGEKRPSSRGNPMMVYRVR